MPVAARFPCPCCGHRMFFRQPGSSEKCPICQWEDDLAQLRFSATAPCVALPPYIPVGRRACRGVSITPHSNRRQHNVVECGAAERRHHGEGEPQGRDEHNIEEPQRGIDYGDSYPLTDTTVLYYWRATYWRRLAS